MKIKLCGFNNLTKSLRFGLFDINYARDSKDKKSYIEYIDEMYNADRLTDILSKVTEMIGANVLNISKQDYDPDGASVVLLMEDKGERIVMSQEVVEHLDKSHITVHTYPESSPVNGISTFRADVEVSTCGLISPLKALDFLISNFESDVVHLDYTIRGFTRDVKGKKHFLDHKINSIQNYINKDVLNKFDRVDVNIYQDNIFSTKMMLKEFEINNYLFGNDKKIPKKEKERIEKLVRKEMSEIYYARNF